MAENENNVPNLRRTRISPRRIRKGPYDLSLGLGGKRSPLKDIQGQGQRGLGLNVIIGGQEKDKEKKIKEEGGGGGQGQENQGQGQRSWNPKVTKGVEGPFQPQLFQNFKNELEEEKRGQSQNQNQSQGQGQGGTITIGQEGSAAVSGSGSVTQGVLGMFQPPALNNSFTEKFETLLGLDSSSEKENNQKTTETRQLSSGREREYKSHPHPHPHPRGILGERTIPLFDYCPDYVEDILDNLRQLELKFKVKYDYMDRHEEISHKMRTILIDWLVEVVIEFDLQEETLHLTVNYIDRFLTKMNVQRTKLQLVGAAALFIAAKFEEMFPPDVEDIVFVTDNTYTKEEIIAMERCMLATLEFDLMIPTAHNQAKTYCSLLKIQDPMRALTMYLVDLSLMEGHIYLRYVPSIIAGAALAIARFVFSGVFWDPSLHHLCHHRESTITHCARRLHKSFFEASSKVQTSIYEKYQAIRYCSISKAFIPHNGPWNQNQNLARIKGQSQPQPNSQIQTQNQEQERERKRKEPIIEDKKD